MKVTFVKSIEPFIRNLPASCEVGAGMNYTLNGIKTGENLFTTGLNTCSFFELNAGKINKSGHIMPERLNLRNFSDAFERIVKSFQDEYGKIKALVAGGREYSFVDPYCKTTSNELAATMCDVLSTRCKIPDEDFASILGKFKHIKTNDDIAIIGDRIYIANRALEKSKPAEVYEDILIPDVFLA